MKSQLKPARSARAEASVWIVRLHSEERTPQLEAGLREWLNAHPQNTREFEHLTEVWELGGAVTADGLPRMRSWRPAVPYLRWAAAAAVLASVALGAYWLYARSLTPSFATDHGEQRLVRLEDGSRISLNSDSRVSVALSSRERAITLETGEVVFEVARDAARPFVVHAGTRQVTALGTTFVVRHDAQKTDVTLVEGKVAVTSPGERLPTFLIPGERLSFTENAPPRRDSPRVETVTAWRRGEVLLDATPLGDAIAEMNRYDDRQLIIDAPQLAAIRVSGVYRTGDSPGFARSVAELHGLAIKEEAERIHLRMPGVPR